MNVQLGVNIDHVATLRQARREKFPSVALAAHEAQAGGANGITVHLREDRRHIQDHDLPEVRKACSLPINLEMALNPAIIKIALRFRPEKVCLVPEKRQELTTEGGLDLLSCEKQLGKTVKALKKKKIEVSLFIDPSLRQIQAAARAGADAIEIHTGTYANARGTAQKKEIERIKRAASFAGDLGLKVHAGHGLDYKNTPTIARIPEMKELNIGFAIVARSVFTGMREAVREMKRVIKHS